MLLIYYRNYPTYFSLGAQFGLDEDNAWRWVKWCEEILIKSFNYDNDIEFDSLINICSLDTKKDKINIVDVTECAIQRSKKTEIQKEYYSGKKKHY